MCVWNEEGVLKHTTVYTFVQNSSGLQKNDAFCTVYAFLPKFVTRFLRKHVLLVLDDYSLARFERSCLLASRTLLFSGRWRVRPKFWSSVLLRVYLMVAFVGFKDVTSKLGAEALIQLSVWMKLL